VITVRWAVAMHLSLVTIVIMEYEPVIALSSARWVRAD
jgi:hypothetical protein